MSSPADRERQMGTIVPSVKKSQDDAGENRPKVGLALSSGAAKGLAHIGVIQVLEEAGIKIDAVSGSSMGAYVGSLYASGCDGVELERLAADIGSARAMLDFLDPVFPPRRGAIRGMRIRRRLMDTMGEKTFEDMERQLFVMGTKMGNFGRHVFEQGQVAEAVHASIAIPGIMLPVEVDGVEYVDGGISAPLPVEVLRDAGMDIVIAVSVIPTTDDLDRCRLPKDPPPVEPEEEVSPFGRALRGINHRVNYFAQGNLFDILHKSVAGLQMRLCEAVSKQADVVIRPVLCDANFHDFNKYARYIEVGRERAEEQIDAISELTKKPLIA